MHVGLTKSEAFLSLSEASSTFLVFVLLTIFVWAPATDASGPASPQKPSMLLVVLDTVRADAVSAYGAVEGTTPAFDALAEKGVLYTRAFAPAPWTLPSHATLFTGHRMDKHHMATPGGVMLPSDFETLAEVLGEEGYETAAFSENAIVSDLFGLLRGFDVRKTTTIDSENAEAAINAESAFLEWLAKRDSDRPFFAFVNVLDAHRPYTVRRENPWVPKEARDWQVRDRHAAPERQICGALPTPLQIKIQRGLYLGDVHDADRKLGRIVEAARLAMGGKPLVIVATSDHGELFGEHGLLGHEFSLHANLLRIPLVVQGAEELASKVVVDSPVGLEDLMPTMISWAEGSVPEGLAGVRLPAASMAEAGAPQRTFFSAYTDQFIAVPAALRGRVKHTDKDKLRQFCSPSNRVYGGMAALVRYPFKYVWYERYPASLYDLSWDPDEKSDQVKYRPELVEAYESELKSLRDASGIVAGSASGTDLSKDVIEALRKLGYVE